MQRRTLIFLSVFLLGVLVGVGFSQTNQDSGDGLSDESEKVLDDEGGADSEPLSGKVTTSRLQRRIRDLERRVLKLEGAITNTTGQGRALGNVQKDEAKVLSRTVVSEVITEALQQDDSPLRTEVSQVVKDEFANMRSEWRAYRKARHEVRDEEFIAQLSASVELSDQDRTDLETLLTDERRKIGEIRTKARETFDVRGAREQRREVHRQTDESALELLGTDGYESWKQIRSNQRPPWVR